MPENHILEAVQKLDQQSGAQLDAMTEGDMMDLLDDALKDFKPRLDSTPSDSEPSSSKAAPKAFDPLPLRTAGKAQNQQQSSRSKADLEQSKLQIQQKETKGKGLTPLPQQRGKKGKQIKGQAAHSQLAAQPDANSDEAFAAQLGKLMHELAAAEQELGSESSGKDQQKEMSETLRALSQEANRLQTGTGAESSSGGMPPFNEPMFAGLQDQVLRGDGEAEMGGLADALMRQLLSKDVLHQPLHEIGEQYPGWLEQNREKLSAEELSNYEKQYYHIQQILGIYANDANNYQRLFSELHQMQQCGQPPDDIVKELAPGMSFDGDGLPSLPGNSAGCCIQ